MKTIFFFFLILFSVFKTTAQQATVTSGGNASGSDGSVSYSIGQVNYTFSTSVSGSLNQGVQQPFEIFTLGTDDFQNINLLITVYPNPTVNTIILKIDNSNLDTLNFQLFDINGKQILSQKISTVETLIDLQNLAAAIYLLKINDTYKTIKTFIIIKNN